jgi:hypothetical protein
MCAVQVLLESTLTWICTFLEWQFWLLAQSAKIFNSCDFTEEPSNFLLVQSATTGGFIIFAGQVLPNEIEECISMFIGAVLAWWVITDASSLATLVGVFQGITDISVSTISLPGGELGLGLAVWAIITVEELLNLGFVNLDTRAMIPVLARAFAEDHHAMIIRTTADAVFTSVIALVIGRGTGLRNRSYLGAGWIGNAI